MVQQVRQLQESHHVWPLDFERNSACHLSVATTESDRFIKPKGIDIKSNTHLLIELKTSLIENVVAS